ncbi:LysR family transcriptional regulator, partial [Streptomyces broussonetiae]|uniref:LysR family transcriptional regulator n=1 Tax=Streptomyces broussonetiae TaxID=2686304 RepID=UPI0035E27215
PADLAARTSAVAQVHVDAWVAPSHAQAARVAEGGLDVAVCWVRTEDLAQRGLRAGLIGADRLYAVASGHDTSDVAARDTAVLIDADATSWSSWNAYAEHVARDTGARAVRITDGGITGPAFFDHVRRCDRPVINSPKGQTSSLPPDLVRRPVVGPEIYWTWSVVWRADEARASVLAVVDALREGVGDLGLQGPGVWLPEGDPHRQ